MWTTRITPWFTDEELAELEPDIIVIKVDKEVVVEEEIEIPDRQNQYALDIISIVVLCFIILSWPIFKCYDCLAKRKLK